MVRAFAGLAVLLAGCAHAASSQPVATTTSTEIARALEKPRTWNETTPLKVRDDRGQTGAWRLDDRVAAPAPPDGSTRELALRDLLATCETAPESGQPLYGPPLPPSCWLRRPPFSIALLPPKAEAAVPRPPATGGPSAQSTSSSSDSSGVGRALFGIGLVGGAAGVTACAFECPKPWATVVPVTFASIVVLGAATLVLLSTSHFRF